MGTALRICINLLRNSRFCSTCALNNYRVVLSHTDFFGLFIKNLNSDVIFGKILFNRCF